MSEALTVTVPVIARVPDEVHEMRVSQVAVRLHAVTEEVAPVCARRIERRYGGPRVTYIPRIGPGGELIQERKIDPVDDIVSPYRVMDGQVYGRRSEIKGWYSRDAFDNVITKGADIAGTVRRINDGDELTTYFNDAYFLDHRNDRTPDGKFVSARTTEGGYGDHFTYVEDCDADPLLAPLADIMRKNAARSIVVAGEIYSPCSGPVLIVVPRASGRASSIELRYAHSLEVLQLWQVAYGALDVRGTFDRIRRNYGGVTTIDDRVALEVSGDMPAAEMPVDRFAEAHAAKLLYNFRNETPFRLKSETIRAVMDLRSVIQRRWPDVEMNWRPYDYTSAFDHMRGRSIPDAEELMPHLRRFLDSPDLGYPPARKAELATVIDYLSDRQELREEYDDIAVALGMS